MGRIAVVVNAGSRSGDLPGLAERITAAFAAHQAAPSMVIVRGGDVRGAVNRALQEGASAVVAGGGDGTVSTVASVLAGTPVPLGILPLGTLNHFAKDLHIPQDLDAAVQTIAAGHAITVDVGDVNGRCFINTASLGVYARLVWEREQQQLSGRGKWRALAVAAVRVLRSYRRIHVVVNNGEQSRVVRTPFVFVGNNEYELEGANVGRRPRVTGGRLQVCIAPEMTRIELVRLVAGAFTGGLRGADHFEAMGATECSIRTRSWRQGVTLDGEFLVLRMPLHFRIRPGMLHVIVPAA
jgi:diacylglycerol kinase family enzyme